MNLLLDTHCLLWVAARPDLLSALPPLHRDPFDRLLLAQATAEGMRLPTADSRLAGHGGPVLMA